MNNIVNLKDEREVRALINELANKIVSVDPDIIERTFDYLRGDSMNTNNERKKPVSINFPIDLLDWIDEYSRVKAVNEKRRITRNMVVLDFLETMRKTVESEGKNQ